MIFAPSRARVAARKVKSQKGDTQIRERGRALLSSRSARNTRISLWSHLIDYVNAFCTSIVAVDTCDRELQRGESHEIISGGS